MEVVRWYPTCFIVRLCKKNSWLNICKFSYIMPLHVCKINTASILCGTFADGYVMIFKPFLTSSNCYSIMGTTPWFSETFIQWIFLAVCHVDWKFSMNQKVNNCIEQTISCRLCNYYKNYDKLLYKERKRREFKVDC